MDTCDLGRGKFEIEATEQKFLLGLEHNPRVHLVELDEIGAVKR